MGPKVSITMPVLNGERYIRTAIDSIVAQTYNNYELLVIDDGSTDRTQEQLKPYFDKINIRCLRHPYPWGISRSVNEGIRNSTGEMIAFLDHDDRWMPEMLETQVEYLQSHPDVGMVHSDFQTINGEGDIIEDSVAQCRRRVRPSGSVFRQLFMDSFIVANSVLIRKECFDRLGGFDESLRFGDYDMWLRIARHYKIDYIPKVLTSYRQHTTQNSRPRSGNVPDHEVVALAVIKKWLTTCPSLRDELGEEVINHRIASIYFDAAYYSFSIGDSSHARSWTAKAIALWPTNWRYSAYYLVTLAPPPLTNRLRRDWRQQRGSGSGTGKNSEQLDRVSKGAAS